ncbi:kinase binding protein CGI-121-domain-containing protein [Globomyces pollinis-pini]|nr:kinase binding protein CGI-121-domain-containing protein [Globomyces pollinis-pini]
MKLIVPTLLHQLDLNDKSDSGSNLNLHLIQVSDVQNPKDIITAMRSKNSSLIECTILDASHILSLFQIKMACSKAYLNLSQKNLKSNSIFTEILYSFSPGSSISDAFKHFGLSATTKHILILYIAKSDGQIVPYLLLILGTRQFEICYQRYFFG